MPSHTGFGRPRDLCYLPLLLIFALHAQSFLTVSIFSLFFITHPVPDAWIAQVVLHKHPDGFGAAGSQGDHGGGCT